MTSNPPQGDDRFDELIADSIGRSVPAFDFEQWKLDHAEEIQQFENATTTLSDGAIQPVMVGRIRHRLQWFGENRMRRMTLIISMAACILLGIVNFWPEGSGQVYGMKAAIERLQSASVLHTKGWTYIPSLPGSDSEHRKKYPTECWMDSENGRFRESHYDEMHEGEAVAVWQQEYISDGRYSVNINHGDKTAEFEKHHPFRHRLERHITLDSMLKKYFGDPEHLDGFKRTGQDHIDGQVFDVWEGVVSLSEMPATSMGGRLRHECWISPATGDFGKVIFSYSPSDASDDWLPMMGIEAFERNVPIPPGIFNVEAPAEFKLLNTKETAPVQSLAMGGGLGLDSLYFTIYFEFALEDGSLLVGWKSCAKGEPSQEGYFTNLGFGGDLPKLPLELFALKPLLRGSAATLVGHHLTHTVKDGQFYEWSLYVPDSEVPPRERFLGYQVLHRCNPADRKMNSRGAMIASKDFPIKNEALFNDFVLGAMAELSDEGKAPEGISYERVMRLSRELQSSSDR